MKIMSLLTSAGLLLGALSAQAQQSCLDATEVQEIRSRIKLATSDVERFDLCKSDTNTYKILEAMIVVKTMQFHETALAEPYSQHILPTDFWTYFTQRANTITDETSCPNGVLAFVYGMTVDGVVHICPMLYDNRITKYERAETVLHEARHFEGYGHVTCTRGPRKGMAGACDDKVEEHGSYAVTVEVLTKMAMNSKDIPRLQKTMVKVLALTYANEVFNIPIKARNLSAFYLEDMSQNAYIYSDQGLVQVTSLGNAKVISRGAALAVFPSDKSDAYTANVFSTSMDPGPAMGSFSAEYNSKPVAEREDVVDIMNLAYLSASVTGREIKAHFRQETADTVIALPWTAVAVYSAPEVGSTDEDSLYVVNEKSEMYRVQLATGAKYTMTPFDSPLGSFKKISVFNESRLALDPNGAVLLESAGQWGEFAPLTGRKFSDMSRSFLWDQYFEDGATVMASI